MRMTLAKVRGRGKGQISARIYRAATGQWSDLGVVANPKPKNRIVHLIQKYLLGYHFATVLTQVGEEWIVDKLDEAIQTTGDYIGWGTGAGTADKVDTTLFTEASEARVTATRTQPLADKIRWVGTLTCAGSGKTITNAGNFTAATDGVLIIHGDHTGQALNVGDKIEYTIDLEIT